MAADGGAGGMTAKPPAPHASEDEQDARRSLGRTSTDPASQRPVAQMRIVDEPLALERGTIRPGRVHAPDWRIFVPAGVIALLSALVWTALQVAGPSGGALARMALLVLAVGAPLVAAHAFLRHQTVRAQALGEALRYNRGWPREMPVDMPHALIEGWRIRRGLSGHLLGGGTLRLSLATGEHVDIADLADPDALAAELAAHRRAAGGEAGSLVKPDAAS